MLNKNIELTDYIEITELKARYCRYMDTKQWDLWVALFTEGAQLDVSDDVPPEQGDAITKGRSNIVSQVQGFVGPAITVHQVHSPEIQRTSANTAAGIWAMSDIVIWPDGVEKSNLGISSLRGYGHYHERYVRDDNGWKIDCLKLTRLHLDVK